MLKRYEAGGRAAWVSPADVMAIESAAGDSGADIHLRSGRMLEVAGTPDEVHAALFPPTAILATPEQSDAIREAMKGQALAAFDMRGAASGFRSELNEALDPRTYEAEWQDRSPEQVRAMIWALGLVRARLGVELKDGGA